MKKSSEMYIEVPFSVGKIKKLKEDNIEAMFMTNKSDEVRILDTDLKSDRPVVYSVLINDHNEVVKRANLVGQNVRDNEEIVILVPIEHEVKPGTCVVMGNKIVYVKELIFDENGYQIKPICVMVDNVLKFDINFIFVNEIRLSSFEEEQKVYKAVTESGYVWNEDKTDITRCDFKPWERVIVFDDELNQWIATEYSHYCSKSGMHVCTNGFRYKECIKATIENVELIGKGK